MIMPVTHLSSDVLKAWREKTLGEAEIAPVAEHLAACAECRTAVMYQEAASRVAAAMTGAEAHPEYEQLEALVKREAAGDERRLLERHLASCATCRTELEDLQALAAGSAPKPRRTAWWIAFPAVAAVAASAFLIVRMNSTPQQLPAGAPIVFRLLDSGRTITVDSAGRLRGLEQAPPALQTEVADALRNSALPEARGMDVLRPKPDFLLSLDMPPVGAWALMPAGQVTPDSQPRLHWAAPPGAHQFVVSVYTTDFQPVATSPPSDRPEWVCAVVLKPGTTYVWTVSARIGGRRLTVPTAPQPEARFRVASETEQGELRAAQATGSQFAVAVTAARLGMREEAQTALRKLGMPDFGRRAIN